jgi:uncharacterized protein YerC
LQTDDKTFYYVYWHKHPIDDSDPVYVGMGQKSRAWAIANSGGDNAAYGSRTKDHYNWFLDLEAEGHTLDEIVHILYKGLTRTEAFTLEKDLIESLRPVFNKVQGLNNLKITEEKYAAAVAMRHDGLSYAVIGEELGLSTMTIYRALNGKTKNIGEEYGK